MIKPELYDCTMREGEQAAGASFTLKDRLELFSLLDNFGFDFIELGWPIASDQIFQSFAECRKIRKNAKMVAFGSTSINSQVSEDKNLSSIIAANPDYACIFGKSHLDHVERQLKITPDENLDRIKNSITFLIDNKIPVFYDAEHYFDAFKDHRGYAISTLLSALSAGAERIILCDTKGGTLPREASEIVKATKEELENKLKREVKLGVHFHNDCGLALANTLESLGYISQVQGTINGIGERVGNLNFSEFIPIYMKKLNGSLDVKLENLKEINEKTYHLAGIDIPEARPFVGDSAFAHKGGIHIDATNKGVSYEHENPQDFGNRRVVLLNSLGGAAGVIAAANKFGYDLDKKDLATQEKVKKLFIELRELEQKGYRLGAIEAEHYLLIEKYFGDFKDFFNLRFHKFQTSKLEDSEISTFYGEYELDGKIVKNLLKINGGPIDAAYKSMQKILSSKYPKINNLKLSDFHVGIARIMAEESTVRTVISFEDGERFKTVGVDSNILESALEALDKGFRYYLNKVYKDGIK